MSELHILLVGKITHGEFSWDIAPLPVTDEPQDGDIQKSIDYDAEVQDYQDYLEDIEFFRRGC